MDKEKVSQELRLKTSMKQEIISEIEDIKQYEV